MADPALTGSQQAAARRLPFWVDELPYVAMLLLALGGVTYASVSPRATFDYWQILVPVFCLICIVAGWRGTVGKAARWRLVWTQGLHWGVILLTMRVLFMPNVQQMLNSDAIGLSALGLQALGTFLAGVHAASWRVCVVGVVLAAAIPAVAFLEQAVLFVLLVGVVLVAAYALILWRKKRQLESDAATSPAAF